MQNVYNHSPDTYSYLTHFSVLTWLSRWVNPKGGPQHTQGRRYWSFKLHCNPFLLLYSKTSSLCCWDKPTGKPWWPSPTFSQSGLVMDTERWRCWQSAPEASVKGSEQNRKFHFTPNSSLRWRSLCRSGRPWSQRSTYIHLQRASIILIYNPLLAVSCFC